jgi:general stress protein 26
MMTFPDAILSSNLRLHISTGTSHSDVADIREPKKVHIIFLTKDEGSAHGACKHQETPKNHVVTS